MNAIIATLNAIDFENKDAIMAELNAEVNRGAEAKAQKWAEYDAVRDELPDGFTRGKLQYAVTKLWVDEIVKIDGKPNTYKKA